ncbi:MAG: hypothetical protein QM730_30080 [Anaerolineales bacterium]
MLTLDAFVEYAKKEIPADELPNYILYAIRVYTTTVVGSSEIMCSVFAPYSEALQWAQNCYSTILAWKDALAIIQDDCLAQTNHNPVFICKYILQKLTPILAQSNPILADLPSVDLSDEPENKVFNILKLGLERLARVSSELEQQNLSWLKEFIDRETEN